MKKILRNLWFLILIALFFGCTKTQETDTFGKKEMFTNYADNLILPAYTNYATALTNLKTAFTQFETSTDLNNLNQLKSAFLTAYEKWQYCEIYDKLPPADAVMSIDNNNYYPCRKDSIDAYIVRNTTTLSFIQSRIKSDKGLPAIEYLLLNNALTENEILEHFSTNTNATAYKAYLAALIDNCININSSILTAWTNYKETFINSLGTDAAGAISLLANSIAQRTDNFKRHQVGIPAGYSGNVATAYTLPTAVEAYHADKSITYMLITLNNMKDVLNGKNTSDGKGIIDYIRTLNVTSTFGNNLADDILSQIDVCIAKANDCGSSYAAIINIDKPKADALFLEAKKLLVLMKVDVPSALGVSITYTDSDGD